MGKLLLDKYSDYMSDGTLVGGKITVDGILLRIECDETELDFFERPVMKRNWTIQMISEDSMETIQLKNMPLIPTEIDMFSDGSLLIVQSRCLKDGTNIERNARRYNPNGQLISAFTLGDGIASVQIAEDDTIWVSYFDEGIFGNFGWDQPLGSDGLVAYNIEGEKIWGACDFNIIDCEALNVVSSKEVYFYYYDDNFLVKLDEMHEVNRYRVESGNSLDQFIFTENTFIAEVDMNTVMGYKIRNKTIVPDKKITFINETGKRIKGQCFMRGPYLYVCGADGVYGAKLM